MTLTAATKRKIDKHVARTMLADKLKAHAAGLDAGQRLAPSEFDRRVANLLREAAQVIEDDARALLPKALR